jgi:hypothetical protein
VPLRRRIFEMADERWEVVSLPKLADRPGFVRRRSHYAARERLENVFQIMTPEERMARFDLLREP